MVVVVAVEELEGIVVVVVVVVVVGRVVVGDGECVVRTVVVVAVELLLRVVVKVPVVLGLRVVTGTVKVTLLGIPGMMMKVGLGVADVLSVGEAITLIELEPEMCLVGEADCVGSIVGETVTEGVDDADNDSDTVGDADIDPDPVGDADSVTVTVTELESVGLGVSGWLVGVGTVGESVTVPSGEGLVPVAVMVAVALSLVVFVGGTVAVVGVPLSCEVVPDG